MDITSPRVHRILNSLAHDQYMILYTLDFGRAAGRRIDERAALRRRLSPPEDN